MELGTNKLYYFRLPRMLEHIINGGGYDGTPLDEKALRIEPEHLGMDDLNIQGMCLLIVKVNLTLVFVILVAEPLINNVLQL